MLFVLYFTRFTLNQTIMKKFMFLITVLVLGGLTVNASTTNKPNHVDNTTTLRGYGNSFIFVENGIEFSIFPDGQFDFYMPSYGPNVNVSAPGISISFNSGYDYNPYLQYDEFGAIIQVEHVPVYYDYYGRVNQIGNVFINYNHFGYLSRIGGLYVYYDSYRNYSHFSGYINTFNPYYVFRPWHRYYRIPAFNHCVVYKQPYRRHYKPVRYTYNRPYTNNYRRTTAVASRRGNTVTRRSELATRPTQANNTPRPRRNVASVNPRTSNQVASKPSKKSSVVKPRQSSQISSPRSNNQVITKPRKATNAVKPRSSSQMHSPKKNNSMASKPRIQTRNYKTNRVVKNNVPERKPKSSNNRTYSKGNKKKQVASNTRSRSKR